MTQGMGIVGSSLRCIRLTSTFINQVTKTLVYIEDRPRDLAFTPVGDDSDVVMPRSLGN